ncbi:hypothetical protein [Variovorax boronicumulans]|uniref:hypothetical protein n=1 Tax=Variovorax boronicumulans TaxID=436515 RepID=UPI00339B78E0
MDKLRLVIEVPAGWACWVELVRTHHGSYAGFAQLSHAGVPRCALVITQQLSWEAALERTKVRADHFVRQWVPQVDTGPGVLGDRPLDIDHFTQPGAVV